MRAHAAERRHSFTGYDRSSRRREYSQSTLDSWLVPCNISVSQLFQKE